VSSFLLRNICIAWLLLSITPASLYPQSRKRSVDSGKPLGASEEELGPGAPFTQDELRALPRVCLAQNAMDKHLTDSIVPEAERKQWAARMGDGYMHIHHYCYGLMLVSRGNRAQDARLRLACYRAAISNFDYVIRDWSNTFPLKPEAYLRKGMTLRLSGNNVAAVTEFANAIQIKPNYTPAYAALIDLQLDLGNREEAEKMLEAGLAQVPDSAILTKKKADMERHLSEKHH
jgi:tetratricopeptide (TPR) repeat protein